MKKILDFCYGFVYMFMNHFVCHIPIWHVRKMFYRLAGMKIGKSHILMNVITDGWRGITIGDGVCINEKVHLDGRGGLTIKDNVSISIGTVILSASHDSNSSDFHYIKRPVVLEERVWTGANSIILPGTELKEGSILAAGSVAIGKQYDSFTIYSGVPAKKISERSNLLNYDLSGWKVFFR